MRTRPRRRLFWLRCCPCHHAACPSALPPSPCPQRRERDAVSPNPVHTPGCANPSTLSSAVTCDYSIGTPLLLHRAPSHLYFCITATQATCHTETPQLLYRCGPIHTETPRVFYSDHADVVRHTQTPVLLYSHIQRSHRCAPTQAKAQANSSAHATALSSPAAFIVPAHPLGSCHSSPTKWYEEEPLVMTRCEPSAIVW